MMSVRARRGTGKTVTAVVAAAMILTGLVPNPAPARAADPAPAIAAQPTATPPFIDVPRGHKFFTPIEWMRTSGLSTGVRTAQGLTYEPKWTVTREVMAAFMYRAAKVQNYTPPATSPFVDVPRSHRFYTEIAWMRTSGLSTGTKTARGREYQPKAELTREAMAAFLYRSSNSAGYAAPRKTAFVDVPTSKKFYTEISWMLSVGMTSGVCTPRGAEFMAKDALSREAMAAFLYRRANGKKVSPNVCASPNLNDPASINIVVNKRRPLNPSGFEPSDLVMPSGIRNTNGQPVRAEAAGALERMQAALAAETGARFVITSGYRSYRMQEQLFAAYSARDGVAAAETFSARPGFSEHQTGLAVDLDDGAGCSFGACFGDTMVGQWLRHNAYRFGFILRYDEGMQPIVGYIYEPWHFRYVGEGVSRDMQRRGFVTLEDYFGLPAAPGY